MTPQAPLIILTPAEAKVLLERVTCAVGRSKNILNHRECERIAGDAINDGVRGARGSGKASSGGRAMKEIAFVLLIWTGRHDSPVTAVEMSSQVTCEAAARKVPAIDGVGLIRAVCVPR